VNTQGAERLVDLMLELSDPKEADEAFDLYSGAGTFTLPLARRCDWVSAVEASGPAIRDLRRNLESAGIDNAKPIGGDAGREFPDTEADIIVVDPPRAGLAPEVVDKLSKQPARAIIYVSCDPATLARDIARFEKLGTYRAETIRPVDLFPQTYHVESVVKLTRARR
jgi:23S rRNA (uracil1939-C5)-methyltransferase